jgi:protein-S-isoprenylcysteine O-methyltransferase Ste14
MYLNLPTLCTCLLVIGGTGAAAPVLVRGFKRRGSGVKYEKNFLVQRAPQFLILADVVLIIIAFLLYADLPIALPVERSQLMLFVLGQGKPVGSAAWMSWFGVLLLISGMIFMIGGWYSLGKYFSTDAELLDDHAVCKAGLFKYVMHPAYSGIIQCLLGASLAATSIFCVLFTLFAVAPLWLKRAKYEEQLLLENLGQPYKEYGDEVKWRRLVPTFFPFGV